MYILRHKPAKTPKNHQFSNQIQFQIFKKFLRISPISTRNPQPQSNIDRPNIALPKIRVQKPNLKWGKVELPIISLARNPQVNILRRGLFLISQERLHGPQIHHFFLDSPAGVKYQPVAFVGSHR
jgi:hypothetical protein